MAANRPDNIMGVRATGGIYSLQAVDLVADLRDDGRCC
jgi:hypothetical protein